MHCVTRIKHIYTTVKLSKYLVVIFSKFFAGGSGQSDGRKGSIQGIPTALI